MPPSVLVIDDDGAAREAVRALLEAEGYRVLEAGGGKEALARLVDGFTPRPDLIILDLVMPEMSGWEFLCIVKSYSRLSSIPILIVSAVAPSDLTIEQGAIAAALHKPCDFDQLIIHARALTCRGQPPAS